MPLKIVNPADGDPFPSSSDPFGDDTPVVEDAQPGTPVPGAAGDANEHEDLFSQCRKLWANAMTEAETDDAIGDGGTP
jgi:hypothetical protein